MPPDADTTLEKLYGVRRASQWAESTPPGPKRVEAEAGLVDEVIDAAKAGLPPRSISGQIRGGEKDALKKQGA